MTTGIAVMAKAPRPGKAKTRLLPILAPDQAARLGAAFLRDVTENLAVAAQETNIVPYVAFAPAADRHIVETCAAPGTRLLLADGCAPAPQGVEKFGLCLLQALHIMLANGHEAACVLNADSPTLPTRLLREAAAVLAAPGDRVVMGASHDGGYYLLGMKQPHAALLSRIDWSTERVAAQTRDRAAAAGLTLVELDPWFDVDEPADFLRLVNELTGPGSAQARAQGAYPAEHTRACLAGLDCAGAGTPPVFAAQIAAREVPACL
jgi:rSAM/selenodomain-associated transferase 1